MDQRVVKGGARIGAAAVAIGISLAGPHAGVAVADGDDSAAAVSAGPERNSASPRPARDSVRAARPQAPAQARRPRPRPAPAAVITPPPAPRTPSENSRTRGSTTRPAVSSARTAAPAPAPAVGVAAVDGGTVATCTLCRTAAAPDRRPAAARSGNWRPTPSPRPVTELLTGALQLLRRNVTQTQPSATTAGNPLTDVRIWLDTFANLYPWWSGSLLPAPLRKFVFHSTPVANPMQVELDLAAGVTSAAIPFSASDPDGSRLRFFVPAKGTAGAPDHGTVVVDNSTGTFTYTPDVGFSGTDTFSFVASDATGLHFHAWDGLLNAAFGIADTSLAGGHRVTATVTVFNNVDIRPGLTADITGDFSVLTYDISGMPFPLSGAAFPRFLNTVRIGSRLNAFDIVNVQEDVAYHPFLIADTSFPDRTPPSVPTWAWPVGLPFSDGLNSLSAYYIESLDRQSWSPRPNPLNPGGFTYSRQHIPGGSSVDVYNVDTSGGSLTNDEIAQLSAFIGQNSIGRAVIVTGDFGQLYSDPGQTLTAFAAANGLTDAWVEVEYGGVIPPDASTCAYDDKCEQPDKVFYRNAAPLNPADPATSPVQLRALDYTNEGLNFLTPSGRDLAAHRPQSVIFGWSLDAVGPMNVDTANWMAELPALSELPLTQLPIPGTHDSGSYGITRRSQWALTGRDDFGVLTELPGFLQDLVVKPIAAAWGRTQYGNLYEQFSDGIRYVDLRLSNEPDGKIYLEHGLRGPEVGTVIADIAAFADAHPREALIVYVQGLKNFTPETNAELVAEMKAAFGTRMVPRSVGTSATLADLWKIDKNVIVVYNNAGVVAADPQLWPDDTLWRPWPNYQSVERLLGANEENLENRPPAAIWGMFGEPTPDTTSIVTGILTIGPQSNEEFMWNVHRPLQQWIRVNFKNSVNLVTTDWYQRFWPAGSSFSRDTIGAGYETLGTRLSGVASPASV